MTRLTTFLGVDQTGAVDAKGRPFPMPAALIFKVSGGWKLAFSHQGSRLEIPSMTRESLLKLLHLFPHPGRDLSRTGLILDSVFGLPASQFPFAQGGAGALFELFQKAKGFSHNGKAYGRDTAEKFFSQFLTGYQGEGPPRRLCELASGANSVFLTKPAQRNIGCGTFRIWKELGDSPEKWFQIWGFELPAPHLQDGPWIFEAYPSLFWKKILGFSRRNPMDLVRYLQTEAPQNLEVQTRMLPLLQEDPDLCDSVVLALSAFLLQEEWDQLWALPQIPHLDKEGWILGL